MNGVVFKGNIKDVCAELEREIKYTNCKGITVENWLHDRKVENSMAKQLGMTVEEFRHGK